VELPEVDLDLRAPEVTLLQADAALAAGAAAAGLTAGFAGQRDDLKRIEGIGPKISRLLNDHGIWTFAQLASASVDRLEEILRSGGPNFQLADPQTWSEQAQLAADGAWDEFQALQQRLVRGQRARPRSR